MLSEKTYEYVDKIKKILPTFEIRPIENDMHVYLNNKSVFIINNMGSNNTNYYIRSYCISMMRMHKELSLNNILKKL
jgi:hypothetical protein